MGSSLREPLDSVRRRRLDLHHLERAQTLPGKRVLVARTGIVAEVPARATLSRLSLVAQKQSTTLSRARCLLVGRRIASSNHCGVCSYPSGRQRDGQRCYLMEQPL
jgi:hypothetical protein